MYFFAIFYWNGLYQQFNNDSVDKNYMKYSKTPQMRIGVRGVGGGGGGGGGRVEPRVEAES